MKLGLAILLAIVGIFVSPCVAEEPIETPSLKIKSYYTNPLEARDPLWPVGFDPSKNTVPTVDARVEPMPPASAFSVQSVLMDSKGATVYLSGGQIVDLNEEFEFDYGGKTYFLKISEIRDKEVVISPAQGKGELVVPRRVNEVNPDAEQ